MQASPRVTVAVTFALMTGLTLTLPAERRAQQAPVALSLQPLAVQARRIETTLRFLGQPLPAADQQAINETVAMTDETAAVARLQQVLDRYVLARVQIAVGNRLRVEQGAAPPELVQGGTRLFLVKVLNDAGSTLPLAVQSPNIGLVYISDWGKGQPEPPKVLTEADVRQRWSDMSIYTLPPMRPRLSGLGIEYVILQIYSRDSGQRTARVGFDLGEGSESGDLANAIDIPFTSSPSYAVRVGVQDEHGRPTTAGFLVQDEVNRIYPNISKRLAPDFYFQPQVYRSDGAAIDLPKGTFTVTVTRGPEYVPETRRFSVDGAMQLAFKLVRWIDPSRDGWFSGDHHIHSAGCMHYQNPTEGVRPEDMWPQIAGEGLDLAAVLTWGPSYYFQKQFFSGADHPLSTPGRLMHYDLEVSGFPSSHAGHLVLLGLKDQDYPGATRLEQWPTWTLPVLRWAKQQGAVTGFAHSGWGLEVNSAELPNYEMPAFDNIGANEFIVDVTHPDTVDFISAGNTPYVWELNIWYHTLNAGFRTRISGETDFPCITDDRVGLARSYCKVEGPLTYSKWIGAVKAGRSYVSDGRAHLMDFTANGVALGTGDSEVELGAPGRVKVTVRAAANLDAHPNEAIRRLRYQDKPYWDLERARVGNTREVPVEIVVNGERAAMQTLVADGQIRTLTFDVPIERSSWIAARILPAAHTNPIFAIVGSQPIRASRRSVQWCLDAVNQCWTQKAPRIGASEVVEARKAYDHARDIYRQRLAETDR